MEPEEKRMIEALAVVDLDPSLTPFDTTCKVVMMLVRVKMDN